MILSLTICSALVSPSIITPLYGAGFHSQIGFIGSVRLFKVVKLACIKLGGIVPTTLLSTSNVNLIFNSSINVKTSSNLVYKYSS